MIHLTVTDCAKLVQAELAHAIQPEALGNHGCHLKQPCCGLCCGRCPICCQIGKALTGKTFKCSCERAIHHGTYLEISWDQFHSVGTKGTH